MRLFRALILLIIALVPLATLVHHNDVGRWELQRSAMAAPDEFSYLLMAQNFLHGGGLSLQARLGEDTFYPPGYPLLLALWAQCTHAGNLTAFTAHALNAVLLSVTGIVVYFFSRTLLRALTAVEHRRFSMSSGLIDHFAMLIALLFAFNWHVLDSSLIIMSEPAFMLATFAWLALALRWRSWQAEPHQAAVIALLAVVAWSMRGAGITCVAATILFAGLDAIHQKDVTGKRRLASLAVIVSVAILYQLILAIFSPEKSLAAPHTSVNSYPKQLLQGMADRNLHWAILSHANDFAESFIPWLREPPDFFVRGVIGKMFAVLSLAGLFSHLVRAIAWRRPTADCAGGADMLAIYLLLYIGLYLLWPFNAARFWMPILPLMLCYSVVAVVSGGNFLRSSAPVMAGLLFFLLLLLHMEEDVLQLGNRARRLNYVSDSLSDAVHAVASEAGVPSRTIVGCMGSDERFLFAWHFSQLYPGEPLPRLYTPRAEHADTMLIRLLDEPQEEPDHAVFFINYFPGMDARDTLASIAKIRPGAPIRKVFQKEIIISVWEFGPNGKIRP